MAEPVTVTTQVASSIDEAIESLRWCRQHLQDRTVSHRLRQIQISMSALALALDYEMDGQSPKAQLALEHADWRPRPAPRSVFDPHTYWMTGNHH
jgi:cob(I)alamin adenosyltransferase